MTACWVGGFPPTHSLGVLGEPPDTHESSVSAALTHESSPGAALTHESSLVAALTHESSLAAALTHESSMVATLTHESSLGAALTHESSLSVVSLGEITSRHGDLFVSSRDLREAAHIL